MAESNVKLSAGSKTRTSRSNKAVGELSYIIVHLVIVISKFLKRYSKAKRTRAPAYSRPLRRIKGEFSKGGQVKLIRTEPQVRFPEYQYGSSVRTKSGKSRFLKVASHDELWA